VTRRRGKNNGMAYLMAKNNISAAEIRRSEASRKQRSGGEEAYVARFEKAQYRKAKSKMA